MKYYLGIDIGTTSTKTVAFSPSGVILARETINYPIDHPLPDHSEQDPEVIFNAVLDGIEKVAGRLKEYRVELVSFSAAMHSLILTGAGGEALTACIIWADNRAASVAESLKQTGAAEKFYRLTGVPVHPMSPFCKMIWLKENNRALFDAAHKFIGIKEFVFFRLFGNYTVDTSIASATGLLNIHNLQWDDEVLDFTGIKKSQLPQLVKAVNRQYLGRKGSFADDKRLAGVKDAAFITGGSDGALANLGSGAVTPDAMAITIGTSSAVRIVTGSVCLDPFMRTFCYHLEGSRYIVGGAGNNGAVVLEWLKDLMLPPHASHDALFSEAATIAPGADGVLFIPYLLGERAPIWNAAAKSVFYGMDISHGRAHLIRAVIEGILYAVYSIGKILMETNPIKEIQATGGFTQSPFMLQLLSDLFNCRVMVADAVESSACGAVKIGMEALGLPGDWHSRTTEIYQPNASRHDTYMRQYELFERLYTLLKPEMQPGVAVIKASPGVTPVAPLA